MLQHPCASQSWWRALGWRWCTRGQGVPPARGWAVGALECVHKWRGKVKAARCKEGLREQIVFPSFLLLFTPFSFSPAGTASSCWWEIWFWAAASAVGCALVSTWWQAGGKQGWEQMLNAWQWLCPRCVGVQPIWLVVLLLLRMVLKMCAFPFSVPTFGIASAFCPFSLFLFYSLLILCGWAQVLALRCPGDVEGRAHFFRYPPCLVAVFSMTPLPCVVEIMVQEDEYCLLLG